MSEPYPTYQTKSAVLFIIFNRPDTTEKVFERIKATRPARLYVAADGPRDGRDEESVLCKQARDIATQINWDCELKTLFKEKNAGCKEAVSSAINWFFDNEEEGIILEDDCLPANSFFRFCDLLLDKYRFDTRIRHISGANFQHGIKRGNATYYFSNITHVWGWASWRRTWKDYDKELSRYNESDIREKLESLFNDSLIVDSWQHIFKELKAGNIDTWDYQMGFTNYFNNSLCIVPNINLISNIGFNDNATHTTKADNLSANIPLMEIDGDITHPLYFLPEKKADEFTLNYEFDIVERRRKQNLLRKRFKRWRKSVMQKYALLIINYFF
ncbi:MAG: hypothetical protein JWR67_218 [Mucilaginibacter sp.]|nr:hypothetical protein [Mucilaginibacter sp.]